MRSFDITRFGKLMKYTIAKNRKSYIQTATIFAAIIVFIAAVSLFVGGYPVGIDAYRITSIICSFAFVWFSTGSALIVSDMREKRDRIADFMLPASKLEKFVARYAHLFVLFPLAALIGVAVGDVFQMLLSTIRLGDADSITACLLGANNINALTIDNGRTMPYDLSCFIIFSNSLFLIGGTIFKRRAWIKSIIAITISFTVLLTLFAFLTKFLLDALYGEGGYDIVLVEKKWWSDLIVYAVLAIFTAFNYWFSYRIYSRMQIVTNRWHNL